MSDDLLNRLHEVELEMLEEIERICRKHNISYFLDSGSCLGAVRHKGFIPWDDDLDIGMMREDYDRFLQVCKEELNDMYFLQIYETDPEYFNFHAKIRKENTIYPQSYTIGLKHRGIQLDIFPFDYVPDDTKQALRMIHKARWWRVISDIKASGKRSPHIKRRILAWLFTPIPESCFRNYFESICQKYRTKPTNHVTCFSYRMARNHDYIFEVSDIVPVKKRDFADRTAWVMNHPEGYLKVMYGDFMQLPPVEKREFHLTGTVEFDVEKKEDQ